jgi:hypothetical protein
MQDIEPFYRWEDYYNNAEDPLSPFYGVEYNTQQYTNEIYGYYIHPLWDYIGSETLYIKILFADYETGFVIIEFFGEWNDALHNDIMHLKRNVIDHLNLQGIKKYILIGENVFNFHGSDDSYYEEWFEDVEEGWIAAINFREHVLEEWSKYNLDSYINFGGTLEIEDWRTLLPLILFQKVDILITRRLT